jgi:uncharacterized DUF497 family protein
MHFVWHQKKAEANPRKHKTKAVDGNTGNQ